MKSKFFKPMLSIGSPTRTSGLLLALVILAATVSSAPAFAQTAVPIAVPAPVANCLQLSSNLYIGAHDARTSGQVTMLQQFLNARYGNQLVTGYFGTMTYGNVARLQQELGISPVGGVGPLTRAALLRACGTVVVPPTHTGLTAQPTSGTAPLATTFVGSVPDANQYIIDFGDGSNSGPLPSSCASSTSCSASTSHTFVTPGTYTATLSRYIGCMYSEPRCMIAIQNIGQVNVTVTAPIQNNGFTVTSPTAGQVYTRGSDMTISWSGLIHETFAYEQHASIVDLYTAAGVKVGTIAIGNDMSGTYQWRVPSATLGTMCTMQYPNGLCGQNLVGQYYIKVTVVVGNGFDTNATGIGTTQSGIFTVQ